MSLTITNVMAISLDGRIGKHALESDAQRRDYEFTNLDDKDWVRSQLETADAVITGGNSLRASRQTWIVKNDQGVNPAWIVVTSAGLEESLPFWQQRDVRRVLVSTGELQPDLCRRYGVENWIVPADAIAQAIAEKLESQNLLRVLLFGGGLVNRLFYEAKLVDFAKITLCPLIFGGLNSPYFVAPGLSKEVKMELISSVPRGNLVFLNYKIRK